MIWQSNYGSIPPRPSKKSKGKAQQTPAHRKRKTRR